MVYPIQMFTFNKLLVCNREVASDTKLDFDYLNAKAGEFFFNSSKHVWMLKENACPCQLWLLWFL